MDGIVDSIFEVIGALLEALVKCSAVIKILLFILFMVVIYFILSYIHMV